MTKTPTKTSLLDAMKPPDGQQLCAAVLTTFDLDLDYFERVLLPTLLGIDTIGEDLETDSAKKKDYLLELRSRLRKSNVVVLADKKRFDFGVEKGMETYEILFAENYPAFHPKLFLLAFDKSFRMVVSSANVKESGFHSNLEVLWMASTEQGDLFGAMANEAVEFLSAVAKREWPDSRVLKETLSILKSRIPKSGGGQLLHSENRLPIALQWRREIGDRVELDEIHVVSPSFDRGGQLSALDVFDKPKVHLYLTETQGETGPEYRLPITKKTLSRIKPECCIISKQWMIGKTEEEKKRKLKGKDKGNRMLHAKLYAVKAGDMGWLLLGSPNFSYRALLALGPQRNAEVAVALSGKWTEISHLLPPVSQRIPWQEIISTQSDDKDGQPPWMPFLTCAEYDATNKTLVIVFSERRPNGAWSVKYQDHVLIRGDKRPFPHKRKFKFYLKEEASLRLSEGKKNGRFPIGVKDKEMLPELPGMETLNYEDILEMLAHGVINLRQFLKRIKERRRPKTKVEKIECRVSYMDQLARFSKAMENIKKRLSGNLTTPGEAQAVFDGDLGFNKVVNGIKSDKALDVAFRQFALLELFSVVSSIKWNGQKVARVLANKIAGLSIRRLRQFIAKNEKKFGSDSIKLTKIRRLYFSNNSDGWHR